MYITDQKFFCEEILRDHAALADIDKTYLEKGLVAAEKQLADFVRGFMRPDDYFKIPYYERENVWALDSEDDFAAAERIIKGELCSCGTFYKFEDTEHIDWEFNPTYNAYREWPWQLSRHHEWRCLGRCYRETGDEKYAKAFVDFLMSWCEQAICPENAHSDATWCWRTIEAGIRMTKNWHFAFHAFLHSEYMTDHVITTYMKSIWEHGYRLSTRASKENWLIMEMAGLSHIAMLYPFLAKSGEWADFAFEKLIGEFDVQVYPDGFQYELTTNYHDVVVQNYYWVLRTAEAIGYKVPDKLIKGLEKMFMLDLNIICPDRRYPDLNDGRRAHISHWCKMGARYFPENPYIKYFATEEREGSLPPYTNIALPYAGQAYMRTGWGENDIWLFLDAGPFGTGTHHHEDKLNVLMFAYGKNVMPDTGTYRYDSSKMRDFSMRTYSHNCGIVDGLDQNRKKNYKWSPEMIKMRSDMKWSFSESVDSAEGTYNEGYGPSLIPVTHSRKVIFFKKGVEGTKTLALVIDRYVSEDGNEHEFATSYQMDTQPYTVKGSTYTADHGDGVTMNISGSAPLRVISAQYEPYYVGWRMRDGADSEEFEHSPAPCLQYTAVGREKRIVTLLYPSNSGKAENAEIVASDSVYDTEITLIVNGRSITVNEKDYPCAEDAEEKLYV